MRITPLRQCTRHLHQPIYVLGLESSADDTCASIVSSQNGKPRILSNVVLRQPEHEETSGIWPLKASHLHAARFPIAVRQAFQDAQLSPSDLSAVAYTRGPGLGPCLAACSLVGRSLAGSLGIPCIGVHHMQAHALTQCLTEPRPGAFPFLTLLVSGGHTLLILAQASNRFRILATTLDSSIGDAFDKISRALELPWGQHGPGAALELSASQHASSELIPFPSKILPGQLAFSYTGLRSAVEREIQAKVQQGTLDASEKSKVAASFQHAAIAMIEDKIMLALKNHGDMDSLVVSGGVASNQALRLRLRTLLDANGRERMRLIFPPVHLCTDNAAMIAYVGLDRLQRGVVDPHYALPFIPKWYAGLPWARQEVTSSRYRSIEECE